ncbi:MAG: response regulator [Planctomycetota bacterium]|jgi:two-component system chemotaxis response regulator CheY
MKILVVDDSAVMRKLIIRAMGGELAPDTELLEAADGMQALATAARHGPSIDLVLCDMNMPNVDGLALLISLRNSPEFRHIPFVIVTEDVSDERVARALREGAAGVIGKPFQPEAIADLVRRKRAQGRSATSSLFRTDTVTRMVQTMSRSAQHCAPAKPRESPALQEVVPAVGAAGGVDSASESRDEPSGAAGPV